MHILYKYLLYFSVSTCAVIDQFNGPYSLLKYKAVFVHKMFWDLSPTKSLKLSFTSEIVLVSKPANDLRIIKQQFQIGLFGFEVHGHE